MELTEFLLARIAEDEEWARQYGCDDVHIGVEMAPGCRVRVLAECEAKRRIVAWVRQWPWRAEPPSSVDGVLQALALPYADHQDYDPEWRP